MSSPKSERTEHRRRLIKAAVGVPVVFTLPSGAALAAASMSCAEKSQSLATDPATVDKAEGVTAAQDTWMRYRLDTYQINTADGQRTAFSLDPTASPATWYVANADGIASTVTRSGNNPLPAPNGSVYALVDYATYTSTGQPTMFVYPGRDPVVNPIAGASCWNSLLSTSLMSNVIN